jgi:hypothetical protein
MRLSCIFLVRSKPLSVQSLAQALMLAWAARPARLAEGIARYHSQGQSQAAEAGATLAALSRMDTATTDDPPLTTAHM